MISSNDKTSYRYYEGRNTACLIPAYHYLKRISHLSLNKNKLIIFYLYLKRSVEMTVQSNSAIAIDMLSDWLHKNIGVIFRQMRNQNFPLL